MNKPLLAVPVVLALALTTGCEDECDYETYVDHCDGNVRMVCATPGVDQIVPVQLYETDCGEKFCVEPQPGRPVCVLSPDPEPLCEGGDRGCEDADTYLACDDGYLQYRFPCIACTGEGETAHCEGGPGKPCTGDADCAPELICSDIGYCQAPPEEA